MWIGFQEGAPPPLRGGDPPGGVPCGDPFPIRYLRLQIICRPSVKVSNPFCRSPHSVANDLIASSIPTNGSFNREIRHLGILEWEEGAPPAPPPSPKGARMCAHGALPTEGGSGIWEWEHGARTREMAALY